ncbi:MAG: hypothetical protein JJT99_07525 [Rhodobacteraceae bacterium]|nr:hypothetical protein [Paracoccaceae bacterium]
MKFVILSCLACLVLASCTGRDRVYRNHQDQYCDENLIFLPDQGKGRRHERNLSPDVLTSANAPRKATPAHCHFQQHAGASEPATLASRINGQDNPAHRFNLAFVELSEDGRYLKEEQLTRLRKSLKENSAAGKRNHVIMFVHGWRHDAALDNANVRTFRTLLNYSSSFVKERDENAVVTGVYVGWRGRSFGEPTRRGKLGNALGFVGSVWTFWARKRASERIAAGLHDLLGRIDDDLKSYSAKRPAHPDTFSVFGHSLGGNMIATAVEGPLLQALHDHTPGDEFALPFADLIVLLNPAAEASKMNSLQRKIRHKAGLPDYRPERQDYIGSIEERRFETLFPITQRPRYLSITSTCSWSEIERPSGGRPKCDTTTGAVFTLAMRRDLKYGEDVRAIGHHAADYRIGKVTGTERDAGLTRRRVFGPEVGATHDMVTNQAPKVSTTFAGAEDPRYNDCPAIEPWLFQARSRAQNKFGRSWDTSYQNRTRNELLSWDTEGRTVIVQIRHHLAVPVSERDQWMADRDQVGVEQTVRSVAPANSPIWNMRAYDNVISKHGGFQNYAMWCALSQMVLDNVAGGPE